MNPRSLKSVLVLLAQILGPFGQIWVFHKFGWVFHKFTENGEFYIVRILTIRHKNRDVCRLNLSTSLRIAMCSQKPGWFSPLIKFSLLLATSFYRAESSIPKMFILHADDTSTQKLEWWNKAWKIGFHWEQNICKVRLGLQIHFCQTLCSPIWILCNSKRYHLTKIWDCYSLEIVLAAKWIPNWI